MRVPYSIVGGYLAYNLKVKTYKVLTNGTYSDNLDLRCFCTQHRRTTTKRTT